MPIATRRPDAPADVVPVSPKTAPETFLGIVADNNNTPTKALVAYVDGMPWTVSYYSQLKGLHNDLRELDPNQDAAFQQYQKTQNLELRVQSALTTSYDPEQGLTSVTGSSVLMYIVPNVNDYFVAEAGTREEGLYRITSVERKVFNRDSVYEINYTLVSYIDRDDPLYLDLEKKVVREYVFSKERLVENISPIMTKETYEKAIDIAHEFRSLTRNYFHDFFNPTYSTLVVPGQSVSVYDFGLVNFLNAILEANSYPEGKWLKSVSMDRDRFLAQGMLWRALLERDYELLEYINQKAKVVPKQYFNRSSWIKSAAFWNLQSFVYPEAANTAAAIPGDPIPPSYSGKAIEGTATMELPPASLKNTYTNDAGEGIPIIKSVLVDDYYILSGEFYTGGSTLSVLEILVRDYLKKATLDLKLLKVVFEQYRTWPVLEQFYYGPLLILLAKEAIVGFY